MTIKEQILQDIQSIGSSRLLFQIWEFIHLLQKNLKKEKGNRDQVLSFAGTLSDEEALAIQADVDAEFSRIEGDW
ncbi:MAG: hypothetical protein IPL49_11205 [Saprospirales bacterium]|nr:hypothetical protein [Saprospirales bacterium]MBK8491424.1 hypothetical protein [Saprospirales bacterium]